jgi:hypothetical protein
MCGFVGLLVHRARVSRNFIHQKVVRAVHCNALHLMREQNKETGKEVRHGPRLHRDHGPGWHEGLEEITI